ncbi:hypothetical protein EYF80_015940 [Liparis tanakae]|uniref:Uncharacterized protein n=1 Tax=Liparis tanakae TaxID=230148 RepID=A0A4Z2I9W9_9TELE|nr:hypothetical protein EYF80_015940 [Liparis tanakae]
MKRSGRERRGASSTTADGEIDSYTACINSLSAELRERKGGREKGAGERWVNMERYGGRESDGDSEERRRETLDCGVMEADGMSPTSRALPSTRMCGCPSAAMLRMRRPL